MSISGVRALFLIAILGSPVSWGAQPQPARIASLQQSENNGPGAQQPEGLPPGEAQEPTQTLKVDVNLVNIFFNVKDKRGALVPGLGKDDFDVLEDGKPQKIKYFNADADQPLTLGILLDTSPSQTNVLGIEKEVGSQFLADVLRPKDEAFLINFDVNVDLLQDFTNQVGDIRRAMTRAQINGGGVMSPGIGGGPVPISNPKGTVLYDAIYLAGNEKLSKEIGRKAMILLTDGEDQGSDMKTRDAIEAAQRCDSIVYVLLIADRGGWYHGYGEGEMRKITDETGGRVVDVGNNQKKLKEAFDTIGKELRTQYGIGYSSTNMRRDGSYRKVDIRVKGDYKVQARKGYYAPGE